MCVSKVQHMTGRKTGFFRFFDFSTNIATGNRKNSEFVQPQPVVRSFAVGFSPISVFSPVQRTGPANTSHCSVENPLLMDGIWDYDKLDSVSTLSALQLVLSGFASYPLIFSAPHQPMTDSQNTWWVFHVSAGTASEFSCWMCWVQACHLVSYVPSCSRLCYQLISCRTTFQHSTSWGSLALKLIQDFPPCSPFP